MLSGESIRVGMAYLNERDGRIRELIEEVDRFRVRINEFDLRSGRLVPPSLRTADKRPLIRWANREATLIELARIHPGDRRAPIGVVVQNEAAKARREQARARMEQVVASTVMHRW